MVLAPYVLTLKPAAPPACVLNAALRGSPPLHAQLERRLDESLLHELQACAAKLRPEDGASTGELGFTERRSTVTSVTTIATVTTVTTVTTVSGELGLTEHEFVLAMALELEMLKWDQANAAAPLRGTRGTRYSRYRLYFRVSVASVTSTASSHDSSCARAFCALPAHARDR